MRDPTSCSDRLCLTIRVRFPTIYHESLCALIRKPWHQLARGPVSSRQVGRFLKTERACDADRCNTWAEKVSSCFPLPHCGHRTGRESHQHSSLAVPRSWTYVDFSAQHSLTRRANWCRFTSK